MFNLTRKMISNSLSNSPKNFNQFVSLKDHNVGFWQFVTFFLSKHEIERFSHLKHVKTSLGRGRSWLRRWVRLVFQFLKNSPMKLFYSSGLAKINDCVW